MESQPAVIRTQCCIAGGGPAGMMLGFLLARAGISTVVLEKHADFFRDFRGDTIHPSTMQVMDELGLLDEFLALPHAETRLLTLRIGGESLPLGDFSHVPGRAKFLAFMPQWDFLDFLAGHARRYKAFSLLMQTEAVDLVRDAGGVSGVVADGPQGRVTIAADVVVAADGRTSTLRARSRLEVDEFGAPIDVLWMRVPRRPGEPGQTFGNVAAGVILVAIDRDDYYQCAMVIHKGGYDDVRAAGLPALRARIAQIAPFLADTIEAVRTWDDVKLLSVRIDRLRRWSEPGFLCIGDAAHAMSPVGGVGINLAIQDAVAAANALCEPLRSGRVPASVLASVQRRREFPTRAVQALQVFVQDRIISRVLRTSAPVKAPLLLRWFSSVPLLRRIPAYVVGVGFRPEHVRTPEASSS